MQIVILIFRRHQIRKKNWFLVYGVYKFRKVFNGGKGLYTKSYQKYHFGSERSPEKSHVIFISKIQCRKKYEIQIWQNSYFRDSKIGKKIIFLLCSPLSIGRTFASILKNIIIFEGCIFAGGGSVKHSILSLSIIYEKF